MKKINNKTKKGLNIIATALLTIVFLSSCKKDSSTNSGNTNTNPYGTFTWTVNGGSTVMTADSASYKATFKTLVAYQKVSGVNRLAFEINLTANTPATYSLVTGNALAYTLSTPYFFANAGNVIIASNSGTKISGTFTATGAAAGGTSAVAGTFTDIPVQ